MILTPEYFKKQPVKVPIADGLGNGANPTIKTSDETLIQNNIDFYELEFYKELLGKDLAKEFITAYNNSVLEENPIELEQKWQDLVDRLFDEDNLTSPASNYVYWFIMDEMFRANTRTGIATAKKDEANNTSFILEQIRAWNYMCEELKSFYLWLSDNTETYEHDEVYVAPKQGVYEAYSLIETRNRFGI